MNIIIFICLLLIPIAYGSRSVNDPVARTKYGNLQGKFMTSRSGRTFCAFLGIPYAAPPVKGLRFLPPAPLVPWIGTREATEECEICLQFGTNKGSEDCLYLNVFTHSNESDKLSTVMVYIHGGGFAKGSSSVGVLGPKYLMDKDIVLVTLQYRLGAFGFLSTEDEIIPGNMGLKDQVKALQWVQENIKAFGGDPGKVTIFGNSAGSSSVHIHMHSPSSRNLFARAISQSGTALGHFVMTSKGKPRKDTEHLAISLNCSIANSIRIVNCLQNKSSSDISNASKNLTLLQYGFVKIFRPVVEVYSDHILIDSSVYNRTTEKPWLVGVNSNEGLFKINKKTITGIVNVTNSKFNDVCPYLMYIRDLYSNLDQISNLTYDFYLKNALTIDQVKTSLQNMVSDSLFVWPTERAIRTHNGPLFYYLYDHEAQYTYSEVYGNTKDKGVSHTDELLMLFSQKDLFPELNEQDTKISNLMVNLWVNFASGGNPTPKPIKANPQDSTSEKFIWEMSSNSSNPKYLHIRTDNLSMEEKLFFDRMEFWRHLPLQYLGKHH